MCQELRVEAKLAPWGPKEVSRKAQVGAFVIKT